MSEREVDDIILSRDKYEMFIIETTFDCFAFFDPFDLFELIDQILIFLANLNIKEVSVADIMNNNDGIIKEKFMVDSIIIQFALNYICDLTEQKTFTLNI